MIQEEPGARQNVTALSKVKLHTGALQHAYTDAGLTLPFVIMPSDLICSNLTSAFQGLAAVSNDD